MYFIGEVMGTSAAKLKQIEPLTTEQVETLDIPTLVKSLRDSGDYRSQFLAAFLMWSVSTQVKLNREGRNWSQVELANRAGLSTVTIIRLEDPKRCLRTSCNTLLKVAHAFNCGLVIRFAAYSELIREIYELQGGHINTRLYAADTDDVLEQIAVMNWATEK